MANTPLDPRDRARDRDDVHTDPYGAPVDRGAYGAESIVVREPYPIAVRNGAGTAALVLGILGVITAVVFVGGLLGLFAVIAGVVGLGRVNRREATNRGSAMTGVVLGLVSMAISIAVGVFAFNNRDKIGNLNDCLNSATTTTAQLDCRQQFQEEVTR